MDKIGNKIYELRKQRGLSQEELAYKLGVARQTISKWELGDATPDFKNLLALSEFFNVDIKYFTGADKNSSEEALIKPKLEIKETKSNKNKCQLVFLKILLLFLILFAISLVIFLVFIGISVYSSSSNGGVEGVSLILLNLSLLDVISFCALSLAIVIIFIIIIIFYMKSKKN